MTEDTGKNTSERNAARRSQNKRDSALDKLHQSQQPQQPQQPAHRVRLPGFITDDEIGLGDVVKRTTSYFGVKPCGGCERRATMLNRWLVFTPRRSK